MWWLIFLLPVFGEFAIAAVPEVTLQSAPNGDLASILESKGQLVKSLKTYLRDMNLMRQLATDAKMFDNYSQTYSYSVSQMLIEFRSFIISGEDNLFDAIKPVRGWCVTAKDLLEAYIYLFNQTNAESIEAQNQIIQSIVAENITTTVLNELNKLSNHLNGASSTLSSILTQLDVDFSEQSPFFESTLRHELVKEKNNQFSSGFINNIVARLMNVKSNPEKAIGEVTKAEEAIKIAKTDLGIQRVHDSVAALSCANQQQQYKPIFGSASNRQKTQAPITVDTRFYLPYKNRISFRFDQTKNFFQNLNQQMNETIRHTDEVKSKLVQNDQLAKTSKITENTVSIKLSEAQKNQMKRAAESLLNQCRSFHSTLVTH